MQRYFIDPNAIEPGRITVRGDDVHHIKNVLRMTVGDHILCCDGQGKDYYTELVSITDKEILCRILSTFPSKGEPRVRVTVASSLPKGDKLEWVLQKATELGADSFLPFMVQSICGTTGWEKKRQKAGSMAKDCKGSGRTISQGLCSPSGKCAYLEGFIGEVSVI